MLDEERTSLIKKTAIAATVADRLIRKIVPGDILTITAPSGYGSLTARQPRGFFQGPRIFSSTNEIVFDSNKPFIVIGKDVVNEGQPCIIVFCNKDDDLIIHNIRKTTIIDMILSLVTFTVNDTLESTTVF